MTTTLSKLLDQHLGKIFLGIRYFSPIGRNGFIPKLVNKYLESKYSFSGHFCCGESSFMVKQILDKYHIPNKVYLSNHSQYIQGEYVTDHCFIMVDELILDLSYRQFVINPYGIEENSYYQKFLLETSPLFIGDREDLSRHLIEINNDYIEVYSEELGNRHRLLNFWLLDRDVTEKYTLDYFKENHQTLENYDKILELIE